MTLYLANGGMVTGELVRETPQEVILRWDYGDVAFKRSEIQQTSKSAQDADPSRMTMPWEGEHQQARWPYQHDVVVKLTKGTVVDIPIRAVTPTTVVLAQTLPGGGEVEQTILRETIEQLLFRPIHNERSTQIETQLRGLFPTMHWYEEGMFTLLTDSIPPTIKEYRRTIRALATDWYLTFHPLLQSRSPTVQQYIVVFENWPSYLEYAATDGVPGWMAIGYFHPGDEILYCFNVLGEQFSLLLEDAFLGQFRGVRDRVSTQLKVSRSQVFVEGQMSEFLRKLEGAHAALRQMYSRVGTDVLRHELTHAMFHNWQLQNVVLSQMPESGREEFEKKRRYLQEDDDERKRQLLEELLKQQITGKLPDLRASNSWFVEGLAAYMEPIPVGEPNTERVAEVQEARTRRQILPLELLNALRMGSFHGMSTQSALYAHAQSWAFCHFLMQHHRDAFMTYLERLAAEHPGEDVDTLPWLLEALGTAQRPLEQQFLAYLERFPAEDPFWLKQKQEFLDLHTELTTLASRLWGR